MFNIHFMKPSLIEERKGACLVVFPDEGTFSGDNVFTFNRAHGGKVYAGREHKGWYMNGKQCPEECAHKDERGNPIYFEPLLLDITTIHMFRTVYDALSEERKDKYLRGLCKDRGTFVYWLERSWEVVSSKKS